MIKLIDKNYSECCENIEYWLIDTDAELSELPAAPPGSYATSVESGIMFYTNTSGEWPKDPSKYESGGGGGGELEIYIDGSPTLVRSNATKLADGAFSNCTSLETVDFPNVMNIGSSAFERCKALLTVDLPNVVDIGYGAFSNCTSLETVDFPNVMNIGSYAFSGCTSIKAFDFPNATSIGDSTFNNCTSLETVDLPNVVVVKDYAFSKCTALPTANFPNVITVEECAFANCRNLTTANFPKLKIIESYAFEHCYELTTIDLPVAQRIDASAFAPSGLKTLVLRAETLCAIDLSAIVVTNIISEEGMPTGEGFVYVPSALYESYIANWIPQVIALGEMGGMSIDEATATYMITMILRNLEDYTVDGTVTGELDESKI